MRHMDLVSDGTPWRDYLSDLILHGVKLGLDNIRALLDGAGNPEGACPSVHLAGTNGKGSTAAFLDTILRRAGFRVGKFTSPHLLDIRERFQINGVPISEECLRDQVFRFREVASGMPSPPTFFELNTAIAFGWFRDERVDAAVVETGMGGRHDATNVLRPELCGITNIALDHTRYLGDTLEAIAFEKAGILKPGVPCVTGLLPGGPAAVVRERAREVGAPLLMAGQDYAFSVSGTPMAPRLTLRHGALELEEVPLGLSGAHQAGNAAIAALAAALLPPPLGPVSGANIARGLAETRWPGRMEKVLDAPPVFLDVAHNPDGMETLAASFPRAVVVFAVSSDKEAAKMLEIIRPAAFPLILTAYTGARSLSVEELSGLAGGTPHISCPGLSEALEAGMARATDETPLLVCGSIYAAGEARRILVSRHGAAAPVF
ncbi:MAG: bifunctional folylpolyglutamate synthase/dihydrofolate synthase [Candidatus Hydrogenedentes bacterium]|nr:bifunctional folylpolyglutamate synthase/dihydrofolate synthase [Candidatus Hydrogenedentota bacterium]